MTTTALKTHLEAANSSSTYEEKVRQFVQERVGTRVQDLQVEIAGNRLVISGRALTYHGKQLVTHAALEATDLLVVQNDVVVR